MLLRGEDGVLGLALADGGRGAVAGVDDGLVGQVVEMGDDRGDLLLEELVRLRAAWATGEEGVADEGVLPVDVGGAARGMPGDADRAEGQAADVDLFAVGDGLVVLAVAEPRLGGVSSPRSRAGLRPAINWLISSPESVSYSSRPSAMAIHSLRFLVRICLAVV